MIEQLRPEVEASAGATLLPIAYSLGVKNVQLTFSGNIVEINRANDLKALSNDSGAI